MASGAVLGRLQQRAAQADQIISHLRAQLESLKRNAAVSACKAEEEKLSAENKKLRSEVDQLKQKLVRAEVKNGVRQVPMPNRSAAAAVTSATPAVTESKPAAAAKTDQAPASDAPQQQQKKKEKKKGGDGKAKNNAPAAPEAPVDVARLNMRIGHIVAAKKHPDADGLYVEEVDVGEEKNRTIVSGLVKHVPLEQMQDRMAIFLLNLKPAKMRGILSEGMIMCASSPDKVEIIVPPPGVVKGERVTVPGFEGTPDAQMNPKKKIFEQVQPELRISADGVATYRGTAWKVEGRDGQCTVPTMRDSAIR